MNPGQLPLDIALPDSATLDAHVGEANRAARNAAAELIAGRGGALFLHGPAASGKTHLLQAMCRAMSDGGARGVYLPLDRMTHDPAAIMGGLQAMDCVCVDRVSVLAGNRDAELALVGLIDALRGRGARFVAADRLPPYALPLALADLASRLAWGGAVATAVPGDADRSEILTTRAAQRGLDLPPQTAAWLVRHRTRELPALLATLDRLDRASLAAKRRLTVAFVKRVLDD